MDCPKTALWLAPLSPAHAVNIQWLTAAREFKECASFQYRRVRRPLRRYGGLSNRSVVGIAQDDDRCLKVSKVGGQTQAEGVSELRI